MNWKTLTYSFEDKRWMGKWGLALLLAMLRPLTLGLSMVPVWGYTLHVMRHNMGQDDPHLPDWPDIDRLMKDGLRYWAVRLVYLLPSIALIVLITGLITAVIIGVAALNPEFFIEEMGPSTESVFGPLIVMGLSMASMPFFIVAGILNVLGSFLMQIGLLSMVRQDAFQAAFSPQAIKSILAGRVGGFLVAALLWGAIYLTLTYATQFLSATIVLACLLIILMPAIRVYGLLTAASLFTHAYNQGASA